MRLGVIIDGARLARWQADALASLGPETDFFIYSCISPAPLRRQPKHALYYLLNLFTIRNRMTRSVPVPPGLRILRTDQFTAPSEGAWQSLPEELLRAIDNDAPAAIIKFGMGLLRIPPEEELAVPILSYHHGDPANYRGRPAGFYELLNGEPVIGQIVQVLSNRLDAGRIVAAAETRALPYSYRATLIEAYRTSPLLLSAAIRNLAAGESWEPAAWGRAYRLPGTLQVLRFLVGRLKHLLAHLLYGLTREKRWRVATIQAVPASVAELTAGLDDSARWKEVPTPPGFRFLADPFPTDDGSLLVEGLRVDSSCGEILRIAGDTVSRMPARGGHFSYPAIVAAEGADYVIPETSDWSPPLAYPIEREELGQPLELRLPGRPRLLDPTPVWHEDTLYLFGNIASEGASILRLWFADKLDGDFIEHPSSPVRISPDGGRMAGIPLKIGGKIYRVGQDLRRAYGDGVSLFRITRLDRTRYAEQPVTQVRFGDRRGPHTLNLRGDCLAFDYYEDSFSLLAGPRRFKERREARRIRG